MATINSNSMYGVRLQFRYKNASQWDENEVLLAGEIGIELDTGKGKIGDGVKTWSEIDYSVDPTINSVITALTARVTTNESTITALQDKDTAHDTSIAALEAKDVTHESRMTEIETKDTTQDSRLDALEGVTVISANPAPSGN